MVFLSAPHQRLATDEQCLCSVKVLSVSQCVSHREKVGDGKEGGRDYSQDS